MKIYVFASSSLTNIWAGVGARMWAVSEQQASNAAIKGKARRLGAGVFGLLYCVKNSSFTVPFVVRSRPNLEKIIYDVWPEPWHLPFQIIPLGTPLKRVVQGRVEVAAPGASGQRATLEPLFSRGRAYRFCAL
jgi:hypothetical protein